MGELSQALIVLNTYIERHYFETDYCEMIILHTPFLTPRLPHVTTRAHSPPQGVLYRPHFPIHVMLRCLLPRHTPFSPQKKYRHTKCRMATEPLKWADINISSALTTVAPQIITFITHHSPRRRLRKSRSRKNSFALGRISSHGGIVLRFLSLPGQQTAPEA